MLGVASGVPLPALGSALSFYDGYRSATLPANLLQAQRGYFGAPPTGVPTVIPIPTGTPTGAADRSEVVIDD